MSRKITPTGSIVSPMTPPQAGFYESLTFLDENGYFHDTQNHFTALARAGLRCVNPRAESAPRIFTVHPHADSLFGEGVTPLGRDLLQILAYEGFEGEIRDAGSGMLYLLAHGELSEYPSHAEEERPDGGLRLAEVA